MTDVTAVTFFELTSDTVRSLLLQTYWYCRVGNDCHDRRYAARACLCHDAPMVRRTRLLPKRFGVQ
jgi:hypothetical protein